MRLLFEVLFSNYIRIQKKKINNLFVQCILPKNIENTRV